MFGTIRLGLDSDKQQTLEERQPIHERCQETPQVQSALERLIAIVDDDTYARDGVRALVESYGYLGITFATSEEYLAAGIADRTAKTIAPFGMSLATMFSHDRS